MRLIALSLLLVVAIASTENPTFASEDRVVAIGDIHGAYGGMVSILRAAGLIDGENKWIGETATLVQTGDFLDRGVEVREVMDLLMSLQRQATRQGGQALILLGNHEVFNLMGDLVDVSPDAFATFADARSETRRQRAYEDYERWSEHQAALLEEAQIAVDSEADWLLRHPPGLLEYLEAIGPTGRYGRWLRSLPTVARVGDTLFMHGGLAPEFAESDEVSINRQVSEEIERLDRCRERLVEEGLTLPASSSLEMVKVGVAKLLRLQDDLERLAEPGRGRNRAAERAYRRQHGQIYECVADYKEWLLNDDRGPHFFRGHALSGADEARSDLRQVLSGWRAKRLVVGHTTMVKGRIRGRFDGRVFFIDTGMLTEVYVGGRASAIEITGNRIRAVYLESTEELSPTPPSAKEVAGSGLYDSFEILPLTLEAPLSALLVNRAKGKWVNGRLRLENDQSVPVKLTTFGKSRLLECDVPPLQMTVEPDAARLTPFQGQSTLRVVTHCKNLPSLEQYMVLEYLIYRSYSLLAEHALGVRLVKFRYLDTDGPSPERTIYGFFVEDIGLAAARVQRRWLNDESHRVADLDPAHSAFVALFQYMVGNADWSALHGPEGEPCCHNTAVLGDETGKRHLLLPYDFDQSGLVNAPYAVPPEGLGLQTVRQRRYRGFCAHNDQLPAVLKMFNAHRVELESLFNDESLPYPKARSGAWKYVTRFYDVINDSDKLAKRILRACR